MLMAVEIDQVQAFVAIVRGGGVTRAASILHLSQPAASRRLDLLERELGAPVPAAPAGAACGAGGVMAWARGRRRGGARARRALMSTTRPASIPQP